MLSRLVFVFLFVVQTNSLSELTDDKSQTTKSDGETVLLRQLLNQETLIRMSLDRKVNELVKSIAEMKNKKNSQVTTNKQLQDVQKEIQSNTQLLQGAKREIQTTNQQLQDAKREIVTINKELQKAEIKFETNNIQLEDAKRLIQTNYQQLQDAKLEIAALRHENSVLKVEWQVQSNITTLLSLNLNKTINTLKQSQDTQRELSSAVWSLKFQNNKSLGDETFTHTGNYFYSNSSHVLEEILAQTSEDLTEFCSRQCLYNLQCNGFEMCTLSGGSKICRLTNSSNHGSHEFHTFEICRYYPMDSDCVNGTKDRITGACNPISGQDVGTYEGCSDCDCVASSSNVSGVYTITLEGAPLDVQCVFKDELAYTVIMDRNDGSVDFYRTYAEYENGFGTPSTETWIGNKYIHLLTAAGNTVLRFEFEDYMAATRYAEYSSFHVDSASTNYLMTVSGYSGDAGDSMSFHNNASFSAKDADHDTNARNCAVKYLTAWWNLSCLRTKLTATYASSGTNVMGWYDWGSYKPLKVVKMLLRKP
uniref:Fibrinogen C domain-containing protein 1-like n=1 Tax=Crassostrea virginica TaxID=6565 RepID=A0A8B8AW99_CRAVI|nr:fibrinogen C domain-containing protein 1-like [Crassostrea virginica]